MAEMNLAELHEALAEQRPDSDCIVFGDRRLTWREVTIRTRRLANVLVAAGIGRHKDRSELEAWECGQDRVALCLRNGNEYLESMLASFKAAAVPFNVNYRYVASELEYLFRDAQPAAVVYHAEFATLIAAVRPSLPENCLLIQVADESANEMLAGALNYESAAQSGSPERPSCVWSQDDAYLLYTGGTTGMPKGVLWRQSDIIQAALSPGGVNWASVDEVLESATDTATKFLGLAPFMHGAGHWTAFMAWHTGGTIVIPSNAKHFDPADVWRTVERERVSMMVIVGNAMARPLIDELGRAEYDLSSLMAISSGGAILSPSLKQQLRLLLPNLVIADVVGSSETGAQGQVMLLPGGLASSDFVSLPGTTVLDANRERRLAPGEPEEGWLATSGHIPLGYLNDRVGTSRTFPVVDGVRYSIPGDRARLREDGTIGFSGREAVTINSGGEKVFAEEVENALLEHPDVYDVVVVGCPNPTWGEEVVAVVATRGEVDLDLQDLNAMAGRSLARYKLPKRLVHVDKVQRGPVGKPDYKWAADMAAEHSSITANR